MLSQTASVKDLTEAIISIESDFDLHAQTIRGVYFWKLVRMDVYLRLAADLGLLDKIPSKRHTHRTRVAELRDTFARSIVSPASRLPRAVDALFFPSARKRSATVSGDIYTAPLLDSMDPSTCAVIEPSGPGYRTTAKNAATLDALNVLSKLRSLSRPVTLSSSDQRRIADIEKTLGRRTGATVNLVEMVYGRLINFQSREPLFRRLFDSIRPKRIVVVCSYGKEAVIAAARDLSIPVIEVQHGVWSKHHLGYHFPNADAVPYFPDALTTFGSYWAQAANVPLPADRILEAGYGYLHEQKGRTRDVIKRPMVVVLSQPTIGRRLASIVLDAVRGMRGLEVVFKLHPAERGGWRTQYAQLSDAESAGLVRVIEHSPPDGLYDLLAAADFQIGVYSTALFEGLAFRCKTILLDLPGTEYMDGLVARGGAVRVATAVELADALRTEVSIVADPVATSLFLEPPLRGAALLSRIDSALS